MNMILLSAFVIVFAYLIKGILTTPIGNSSAAAPLDESEVSKLSISADYVGGMTNILEKTQCMLILMKDKINFRIDFKDIDMFIAFNMIMNVKVQSAGELCTESKYSFYLSRKHKESPDTKLMVITYFDKSSRSEQMLVFEYSPESGFLEKYYELFNYWYTCETSNHTCSYAHNSNSLVCNSR